MFIHIKYTREKKILYEFVWIDNWVKDDEICFFNDAEKIEFLR